MRVDDLRVVARTEGPGAWATARGTLSQSDLEAGSARLGATADGARIHLWQRLGLFPLPAEDGYHAGAPALAELLHALGVGDPRSARPEALRRAGAIIGVLRARAGRAEGPAAAEERFHELVRAALRKDRGGAGSAGGSPPAGARERDRAVRRLRWITEAGTLPAREIEAACLRRGVRLDRARRTYWQAGRVFPQPQQRRLRPPEGRGGVRGYYHAGAVDLAVFVDYMVRADHPLKGSRWRWTVADLAPLIAEWRSSDRGEDAFYARIGRFVRRIEVGDHAPELPVRHRDVLPVWQRRIPASERPRALETTARVAEAIADAWLSEHGREPGPDRLVVWLRLERGAPDRWRIVDAGARRTSHALRGCGRPGRTGTGPGGEGRA